MFSSVRRLHASPVAARPPVTHGQCLHNKEEHSSDMDTDIAERVGARGQHLFEISHECHQEPW